MDLLEVINKCSDSLRRVKEASIKYGGHQEECELSSIIFIIRGDEPQVGLVVDDDEMRAAFKIAAMNFMPDALVVTRDGWSLKHKRRELCIVAVGRDGEVLWKVYPYAVVGTLFLSNGFEVPDEMPFLDGETVQDEMREIIRCVEEPPLHMSQFWPDKDRAVAEMDTILAKGLEQDAPERFKGVIQQVQLYSQCGTSRQDVLLNAGIPVVLM